MSSPSPFSSKAKALMISYCLLPFAIYKGKVQKSSCLVIRNLKKCTKERTWHVSWRPFSNQTQASSRDSVLSDVFLVIVCTNTDYTDIAISHRWGQSSAESSFWSLNYHQMSISQYSIHNRKGTCLELVDNIEMPPILFDLAFKLIVWVWTYDWSCRQFLHFIIILRLTFHEMRLSHALCL